MSHATMQRSPQVRGYETFYADAAPAKRAETKVVTPEQREQAYANLLVGELQSDNLLNLIDRLELIARKYDAADAKAYTRKLAGDAESDIHRDWVRDRNTIENDTIDLVRTWRAKKRAAVLATGHDA